jgi:hypothetical protein
MSLRFASRAWCSGRHAGAGRFAFAFPARCQFAPARMSSRFVTFAASTDHPTYSGCKIRLRGASAGSQSIRFRHRSPVSLGVPRSRMSTP